MNTKIIEYIKQKGFAKVGNLDTFKEELVDVINSNLGEEYLLVGDGAEQSVLNTGGYKEQLATLNTPDNRAVFMANLANRCMAYAEMSCDKKIRVSVLGDGPYGRSLTTPSILLSVNSEASYDTFISKAVNRINTRMSSIPSIETGDALNESIFRTPCKVSSYTNHSSEENLARLLSYIVNSVFYEYSNERYYNVTVSAHEGEDQVSPEDPHFIFNVKYNLR